MLKRLGGIKGYKYKTSWHLNRFPDADNIGSTVKCRGETHRYTVVVVVVVFTLKAVPLSTQYFLTSVLVQLTRTPSSVVTG